jgi:hypothetical protein
MDTCRVVAPFGVVDRSGIDGKPGERLRFDQTLWRWVRRLRGGRDLWSIAHKALYLDITMEPPMVVAEAQGLV